MTRSRGENTRRESWYGSTISRWAETGGRNYNSHGTVPCLSPRSSIGDEWLYAGSTVIHVNRPEAYRGRAGMDGGRAAWMCCCLKESRLGECLGTSAEEGTLPRGNRPVLRPRPKQGRRGCMERTKLVPFGEQHTRALIKPRSEPGWGDTLRMRRKTEH